jgi:cytochrome b pre-mRNA-processing protein 3
MFAWTSSERRQVARSLYGSSVTAARTPTLYAEWGVPDTLQGRFEMIALHVVLLLHRLGREEEDGRRLGVALTEAFVIDLDDGMRELTFGDLAVPREVKRATAALFDRHSAYLAALSSGSDMALADTLAAQLAYLGAGATLDSRRLAGYVRSCVATLESQAGPRILAGSVTWPGPEANPD